VRQLLSVPKKAISLNHRHLKVFPNSCGEPLTPARHQAPDRAFTFLLRYQILEEKYSDIANDPQKYREQPDHRKSYALPNVKRDVDEAARQAGLEPRASHQGRPRKRAVQP
jgi:hypothetical protein